MGRENTTRPSPNGNGDEITSVESWTCTFDLPSPLVFEDFEIASREYIVLRLTTLEGLEGVAYGLTRGAPTAVVLERLVAPHLLGQDSDAIQHIADRIERSLVLLGMDGLPQRAISLADICLWDIKARRAGEPLWRILGNARESAPTLLVDCYPQSGDRVEELVAHLDSRVAEGYRAFKLHAFPDPLRTRTLLEALRGAIGPNADIVVDTGMQFERPEDAIGAIKTWTAARPAWVEDPFRGDRPDLIRQVREAADVPIGAGDEVASPGWIRQLLDTAAVDVVRLDATIQGGFTGFGTLASRASAAGVPVSPHVYPEIHQHCVFAWPGVSYLELFVPNSPYDRAEAFLGQESLTRTSDGRVTAPIAPGLGLSVDWESVEAHTTHRTRTEL